MLSFADFLRTERESRNLKQAEIARKCGFSTNSTISRIESNETSPMLSTAVHICKVLELSSSYVLGEIIGEKSTTQFSEIVGKTLKGKAIFPISAREVLLDSDLKIFQEGLNNRYDQTLDLLCKLLTATVNDVINFKYFYPANIFLEDYLKNKVNLGKYPIYNPDFFESIIAPNPVMPLEIVYPDILPSTIFDIWKYGGVLISQDVGRFIKAIRGDEAINIVAMKLNIAPTTMSNIERGQFSRITLDNAMHLDNLLSGGGAVVKMLWDAENITESYKISEEPFWNNHGSEHERNGKLIQMLVIISRWCYTLPIRDPEWLNKIREKLSINISPS